MAKMSTAMRRLLVICTLGSLVGIFVSLLNPVNSTLYRIFLLLSFGGVLGGGLMLLWKFKWSRIVFFLVLTSCAIPFLLPGQAIDQKELRDSYVQRMIELENTTYHWGGETSRGIDCSGLPRKALREALWGYGVKHANGRAFRMLVEQWWFDTSADAMGKGYRDFTVSLDRAGTISEMSYAGFQPGDMAVTKSGIHVLVYLGDEQWIQADPGIGYVVTLDGRKARNAWFEVPVTVHRWSVLAEE